MSAHLLAAGGTEDNVLLVAVLNDAWFHGKQFNKHFLRPGGISYSPSSGIWQTVWAAPTDRSMYLLASRQADENS